MDMFDLNLGSFGQCIDYFRYSSGHANYPSKDGKALYYMSHDGRITKINLTGYSDISVPLFDVGSSVKIGRISDPIVVKQLLRNIELSIFAMIHDLIQGGDESISLENIHIPIHSVQVFDEDKRPGCYGYAQVGVAIIV